MMMLTVKSIAYQIIIQVVHILSTIPILPSCSEIEVTYWIHPTRIHCMVMELHLWRKNTDTYQSDDWLTLTLNFDWTLKTREKIFFLYWQPHVQITWNFQWFMNLLFNNIGFTENAAMYNLKKKSGIRTLFIWKLRKKKWKS